MVVIIMLYFQIFKNGEAVSKASFQIFKTQLAIYLKYIMSPARGFIIGIANFLIECTKCDFAGLPCWLSNLPNILFAYL